jgi:hypothetical protein
MRRVPWKPRASATRPKLPVRKVNSALASKEFARPMPFSPATIARRSITLTWDAIVLTVASPFFAAWWAWRTIRRHLFKNDP